VVWVSHDVEADRRRADLLLALEGGRPAYFGPASQWTPEPAQSPKEAAC
jgi:ABC-type sulfate/molybdate transport systems ATPase subunit